MAQNNEVAAKEPNNLLAKIGLLTSCLDAKINPYGPYTKASKKTPEWVASRLEGLIKDLAAKKDYFEIKYFEAMSKKLKLESEKRKLEHRIQDLTFLLCKHDTSTPAAISFSPTDSELSDESDC